MSLIIDDRIKAEVDTMQKKKDKVFISRMVETLTKLEIKYLTTRHKKKRLVIDMARTKQIEKTLPAKHAWGSFETDDESNEDETETSIISQFESWNFTNVPNPNVSSDEASTEAKRDQSDLDVVKCVNTSDESNTRTFISLPLDQGSPIYQNLASSPSPPTARSSLTTGTCDEQSIYNNLLQVDDVSLEPNDDIIDQVPIGNNSPPVPSPGDGPVVQQDEETVPVPPPPDIECQDRPQRTLRRVDYRSLHGYCKEGEGAWLYGREGKDAWLPQLQTRQEGDKEGTQEEMEDGERRGAPDS